MAKFYNNQVSGVVPVGCDTNNNDDGNSEESGQDEALKHDESSDNQAASVHQIIRPTATIVSSNTGDDDKCLSVREETCETLDGSTCESGTTRDNWHLLDADGQSVVASSASSLSSLNEHEDDAIGLKKKRTKQRSQFNCSGKMVSRSSKTTLATRPSKEEEEGKEEEEVGNDFVVARLHQHDGNLSPILIHICTVIYSLLPLASLVAFITLISLLFTPYWPITVAYFTLLILDSNACNKGGRRIDAFYKSKFWSYLAAYFPIQLRHSSKFKLDPNENYILNYHPHGISAFGCVSAFATNGLNFSELFPGIRARFMVHETSFLVPIMRETFSYRGDCSVNSKSFDYILSQKWNNTQKTKTSPESSLAAGNLLALCGGGLAEADLSDAECLRIVVATRKGFIKKALIHGANLIPCIAFGENSVFKKVNLRPGSLLHRMENKFYSLFKFRHPIYYGQSSFTDKKGSIGFVPYKKPINVIMGDPIKVTRVEQPSQQQIDELHATYIEQLRSIYVANKHLCTKYDTKLELV